MKKRLLLPLLLLTGLLAINLPPLRAQNTGYAIGAPVAPFTLKGADGKAVALADFAGAKAVVVVFTNPFCPYTKLYDARLAALAKAGEALGIKYVFVNPSPNDKPTDAQQMAATGSISNLNGFPYLMDEGQKVTKAFGATKTPEAFVLQTSGGQFVLRYRGAIDDNPQVEADVREPYLRKALDAVVAGKVATVTEKRAAGCMIKTF